MDRQLSRFTSRPLALSSRIGLMGLEITTLSLSCLLPATRFWVSGASDEMRRFSPNAIGGATGRVLLVVEDPESLVRAALAAGATQKSPVANEHGWLLGRLVDPSGHEWEVGRPLGVWPPTSEAMVDEQDGEIATQRLADIEAGHTKLVSADEVARTLEQ